VQDLKGERFIGVPQVLDVPAAADAETISLGSKETASFNRVAKARYSQLEAKWLPKGRPAIVDAQTRERARSMEAARAGGREQFKRKSSADEVDPEEFNRRLAAADLYEVKHYLELH
jgi:hypothetical protein